MRDTKLFKAVLILSFLASLKIVLGQEKRGLTEAEAIELGLKNSKSLNTSQSKIEAADAKADELNTQRLPSVKLVAGFTKLSEVPTLSTPAFSLPLITKNYNLKLTAQENIFTGFKIEQSLKAAKLSKEASELDFKKDKTDVIFNVRSAYWNLFKAKETKKVVDENPEQVKAHLKDAQNLFAQGMITNNDVLKIQVQQSNVQLLQIDANNAVRVANVNLNNLLGLPLITEVDITSTIATSERDFGSWDALIQKGWSGRNDIKAMELRLKAGEAGVKAAKGGYYPQVAVLGNYYYNRPNPRYFPQKDKFNSSWDIGVQASFDLWNWGGTADQVRQARTQVDQAKDALGLIKDGVSLEVTQSYLAMLQAREKITVSKQSVDQAQESYRITSEKYKKGLALTTDLLDAEVAVLQAKTNLTNALVDYELAQARLLKSTGE